MSRCGLADVSSLTVSPAPVPARNSDDQALVGVAWIDGNRRRGRSAARELVSITDAAANSLIVSISAQSSLLRPLRKTKDSLLADAAAVVAGRSFAIVRALQELCEGAELTGAMSGTNKISGSEAKRHEGLAHQADHQPPGGPLKMPALRPGIPTDMHAQGARPMLVGKTTDKTFAEYMETRQHGCDQEQRLRVPRLGRQHQSRSKEMNNEVELAELKFLGAYVTHRARICYAMVFAGIVCLGAGVAMLVTGLTGDQVVWFETGSLKITAGGFGAVTMLASVAWGYVAYLSRAEVHYDSPRVVSISGNVGRRHYRL